MELVPSPTSSQGSERSNRLILVTGATGYIGGRLVPCLLKAGYRVRCMVRDADRLSASWSGDVEIVEADVLDASTLAAATEGVDTAYYLIHSLYSGADYATRDREGAQNFGSACKAAGVDRIIYLGGIKPKGEHSSEHLESRLETGDVLRASGVSVTEFRAAVIVGSGSLSFEMIRYLTERVPIMVCPAWVQTPTQPIAVRNVLQYLTQALERPASVGRIFEIGGQDVLAYRDMFDIYAQVRGLKRWIVEVPFVPPRLSAHWVGVITPINYKIARPLLDGLKSEVVVTDFSAEEVFDVEPIAYEAAVRLALQRYEADTVETIWHGAYATSVRSGRVLSELKDEEGMLQDVRTIHTPASPESVFHVVESIGGDEGWLYADFLWELRGWMDEAVGGFGTQRGRRTRGSLRIGDAVDFWRVEALQKDRLLRLRAEMKLPGRAWLQFEVCPDEETGGTQLIQTAFYEPKGLFGLAYWYAVLPMHGFVFPGMIRGIVTRAEEIQNRYDRLKAVQEKSQ